jgi:hypothetical protein
MHTVGTVGVGLGVASGVGVAAGPKQVCLQDRSGCVCALTERGTTTTKHSPDTATIRISLQNLEFRMLAPLSKVEYRQSDIILEVMERLRRLVL